MRNAVESAIDLSKVRWITWVQGAKTMRDRGILTWAELYRRSALKAGKEDRT